MWMDTAGLTVVSSVVVVNQLQLRCQDYIQIYAAEPRELLKECSHRKVHIGYSPSATKATAKGRLRNEWGLNVVVMGNGQYT